jgi:hypothetical protein
LFSGPPGNHAPPKGAKEKIDSVVVYNSARALISRAPERVKTAPTDAQFKDQMTNDKTDRRGSYRSLAQKGNGALGNRDDVRRPEKNFQIYYHEGKDVRDQLSITNSRRFL